MASGNSTTLSLDELIASNAVWKAGNSKNMGILRSVLSWVSIIASFLLISIVKQSRAGFSTTYHRLLLGMCVANILFSLNESTFNAISPIDVSYAVWNARGSQATCTAFGAIGMAGMVSGPLYSCSLNLYSLAVVKYNMRATYISTKIEPLLHAVPIATAVLCCIIALAGKNFNDAMVGICTENAVYDPQHCEGYEDGEIREGFNIPCGRGRDGFPHIIDGLRLFLYIVVPIVIAVSLWMIYRSVATQEAKIGRYGVGALNQGTPRTTNDNANDDVGGRVDESGRVRGFFRRSIASVSSYLKKKFGKRSSDVSNSRKVMYRAIAYSISYYLTWSWTVIYVCIALAGAWNPSGNQAHMALAYLMTIFSPLQGFFNFLIFMHPKVMSARRGIFHGATPFRKPLLTLGLARGTKKNEATASSHVPTTAAVGEGAGRRSPCDIEEEKEEIQGPLDS